MRTFLLSIFAVAALAANAHAAPIASDAWVRIVPGQPNGAGYLNISNPANDADALLSISSDCCAAVELHEMTMAGEAMQMRRVDEVALPAKQVTEFEPMGEHVMFIGFKKAPLNGLKIPATLHYESGATQNIVFRVKLVAPDDAGHAGHHS